LLFKYNRPNTGEDWSEKIASEVAALIRIPHAVVELAVCEGNRGVLSRDFTEGKRRGQLAHGNELLAAIQPSYPLRQLRGVAQHSIENIIKALGPPFIHLPRREPLPTEITRSRDLFLGYLMLDALIGNTDRHHENWGILVRWDHPEHAVYSELAPSFDHASSLGRELSEEQRIARLETRDSGFGLEAYAAKAISAVYASADDNRPLSTIDAFIRFSEHCPEAGKAWLDRLRDTTEDSFAEIVARVPRERLSEGSGRFVAEMLRFNRLRLLGV